MEEKQLTQNQIKITQKSGSYNYKMIIPEDVENKIVFTCHKVWNTEWSGILFFTYKGSFENNDLIIKCKDIYIMDIGNSTYTEFDMNPDVIAYMTDNPELLDCQIGLIHSHSTFSTFFSSTDVGTLREEGKDRNNFVSLIVNNAGTYTAAITRKIKHKKIMESVSYDFFDEGEKKDISDSIKETDEIEWFNLKIEKETSEYNDINERLEEIKKQKSKNVVKQYPINNNNTLFDNSFFDEEIYNKENGIEYPDIECVDNKITEFLIKQILSCSILIKEDSKLDINEWAKNIVPIYEKRFGKNEKGMDLFKEWAGFYIPFIIYNINDATMRNIGYKDSYIQQLYTYCIVEKLSELPKNKYIDVYIEELNTCF